MTNIDNSFLNKMQYESSRLKETNSSAIKNEDAALRKASDDFESFFVQQFLDVSLKNTNIAGNGVGKDILKGMYTEALSKNAIGTFGISDMIYKFLSENKK